MANWYLLNEQTPRSAAENMARDEYLFNLCHTKKCGFLRLYSWEKPTFSFGVSQRISSVLDLEYIEKNGFSYVRRITGGKTVLHDDEITYAVASSENVFFKDNDLYRSYLLIAKTLAAAFKRIGLEASLSSGSSAKLSRSNNPCFSFPTPNEIEIAGKKIVGSAQKRDNTALLQHGSIPITMNYERYACGANSSVELIESSMTTLSQVSPISRSRCITALIESFESFIGEKLHDFDFSASREREISGLVEKYASQDWNFNPQPLRSISPL